MALCLLQFALISSFAFCAQVFQGNTDNHAVVKRLLPSVVVARFVRIVPLKDGNGATPIALRVEIHGCPGNVTKQTKHSNKHVTHVCLFIFVCLFVCLFVISFFIP